MGLKEFEIKNAKPHEKARKLSDGEGLFLLVTPKGSKYWRLKYRFGGKEKLLALGVYDQVSLAEARIKRNEARNLLAKGIDPGLIKQATKRSNKLASANSLETVPLLVRRVRDEITI